MSRRKKNISRWFNRRRTKSTPSKFIQRRRDRRRAKKANKGRVPSTFGINPSLDISKAINPVNFPKVPKNDLGLKSNLPQVSLSDRPKNLNEVEEQKDIVTKLEEGTNDNETQNILDRGIDLTINVIDEFSVNVPDVTNISYPKVIRGADFIGYDVDFKVKFNVEGLERSGFVEVGIGRQKLAFTTRENELTLNVKDIIINYLDMEGEVNPNAKRAAQGVNVGDKVTIPIYLTPVNQNLRKEQVRGETESFNILFDKGDLNIPRELAINRLAEGFISQFSNCGFDDSKYLTHLLHLGDGDNKVITTWVGSEDSLILKLYEPLPANVQTNQKVFISKIQSNPIIETITLVGDGDEYCPPLQGPNFSLEVDNGIGYQVYDDLLASGSATNTSLIREYVSKTGIDTDKLNIEYVTGSDYTFQNYVHFGSAEERIKNFWYKIGLLETYQSKYTELTTTDIELGYVLAEGAGQDGYVIITEDSSSLQLDGTVVTATTTIQANKQLDNINNLIGSFDGFENFLYTSTDDLAYPKSGNSIVAKTDSTAIAWYNGAVNAAANFDRNNVDYLNNNLPEYIREDYQNEDFMLFMDMLGHHFDIVWAYINTLNKLRTPQHKSGKGFSNELVYTMLESLGWDGKKAFDSQFLWEYALGQHKDGTQKYQQSLKSANEEIWRRILNNLPYLLKHKGTSRSLKAVMACYGVPQSLLTIMEFGGPTDPTDGGTQPFTFEDRTASLIFTGSQYISVPWKEVDLTDSLETIEMNVKFNESQNHNLLKGWDGSITYFGLDAIQTTGSFGKVKFFVSASSNTYSLESSQVKLFDENYKTIVVTNQLDSNSSASLGLYVKESLNDRLVINYFTSSLISESLQWDAGDTLLVGSSSYISLDEFRIWKDALDDNIITTHTKQPDSIAGNNYTASSEDLLVRFDFEYPQNRFESSSISNVAISSEYDMLSSSLFGFPNKTSYPYNHEVYERTVTAQVPSLGFNSSDKIRFESQTLVGDLSHKVRATKKSLDRAPIDSSRLGLFFSPIKELNMDIVKSFGNFNIDNYIGAPADEYKDEYSGLKEVRDYYFQRLNRDIYEYIRLVRYIDKSLFDVLEDLVPARAKVSKGLLIEPHYLERSKTKWEKPTSEKRDYETNVDVDEDVTLIGDNNQFQANIDGESDVVLTHQYDNYEANIDGEEDVVLTSTNPQYDSSIDVDDETTLSGTYPTYVSSIEVPDGGKATALIEGDSFQQVGMDPNSLANAGFGLYTPIAGTGSLDTIDIFGNVTSSRKLIFNTKEQYIEKVSVQTKGYPATSNNEQVEYELQDVTKFRNKVTILPIGSTPPSVGNDITQVIPLNGYFPTHYRYKNNLSEGLKNSFFNGSKQTADTTPDGLSPVETFTTNPNILRVADTGRGSGEPILEVD
jgi:hypothetical protein